MTAYNLQNISSCLSADERQLNVSCFQDAKRPDMILTILSAMACLRGCTRRLGGNFREDGRRECLDFVEKNWTEMRPNSLIRQMEADAAVRQDQKMAGDRLLIDNVLIVHARGPCNGNRKVVIGTGSA
jgi:hypothetical protein